MFSLITQPIDNTKLITLRETLHPMAASQFARGAAPASLPMDHMLLVLKRSGDQEAALETLLTEQLTALRPITINGLLRSNSATNSALRIKTFRKCILEELEPLSI